MFGDLVCTQQREASVQLHSKDMSPWKQRVIIAWAQALAAFKEHVGYGDLTGNRHGWAEGKRTRGPLCGDCGHQPGLQIHINPSEKSSKILRKGEGSQGGWGESLWGGNWATVAWAQMSMGSVLSSRLGQILIYEPCIQRRTEVKAGTLVSYMHLLRHALPCPKYEFFHHPFFCTWQSDQD